MDFLSENYKNLTDCKIIIPLRIRDTNCVLIVTATRRSRKIIIIFRERRVAVTMGTQLMSRNLGGIMMASIRPNPHEIHAENP